jgi:capsular polysaccharide biosynthesis protein
MNSNTPDSPQATAADQSTTTPNSPPRFPFSLVFMVWLAVVLVGTLITYILPESFVSKATIKVERDKSDIEELGGKVGYNQYDPYYIATEFEVIQSELILGMVVSNLNLNIEWGKKYNEGQPLRTQETLTLLRGRINLRPVRNTMLIDINVYGENPTEAAKLANNIAESYKQFRLNQGRALSAGGLDSLSVKLQEQDEKIRKATEELANLAESAGNSQMLDAKKLTYLQKKQDWEDLGEVRRLLRRRMAIEDIDKDLPRSAQVIIVETAKPGFKPVLPNKPLNIIVSIFVGGFVGLLLAVLVYLLDRRAFQSKSGVGSTTNPRLTRTLLRTAIALVVGVVVGYNCAEPLETTSMFGTLLFVVLGGIAFVYIELAKPTSPLPSPSIPPPRQW